MLTFWGQKQASYCDRVTRRDFLRLGGLGLGGLTLADVLRLRALAKPGTDTPRPRSVIMIWLFGGPSHIDMYDMKPDAPVEYRGEFQPIQTKLPGLDICELMPRQAALADRFSVIRNFKYRGDVEHIPPELLTGWTRSKPQRPAFGSIVSKLKGSPNGLPPYVSLMTGDALNFEDPSYAGVAHRPFTPSGPGLENLQLSRQVSLEQLQDRRALLTAFDGVRREIDEQFAGYDAFTARALEMIASPRTRAAFDVAQEPESVRARYGQCTQFLLARRLVEAGVQVVTVHSLNGRNWDSHQNNFRFLRQTLPLYDQGVSALVADLYERGLDQDVMVLVWGEMGRTPKVNKDAGRDHWWTAGFGLVAGGGLQMGQVIGATDRRAELTVGGFYTPQNMLATIYHVLGIDPAHAQIMDNNGRPMNLLDDPTPIKELL